MRALSVIAALLFAFPGCSGPIRADRYSVASQCPFGVPLPAEHQQHFIHALTNTSWDDLESELPRKLAPLRVFQPYFSMYELASTAYALVLELPSDTSRWRALAKLDSYADGEYSRPYEAARREALTRNARLLDHCPQFRTWSDSFRPRST